MIDASLARIHGVQEQEFLEKADEELEKVNKFYAAQEADMLARGEALIEQLRILADVKRILADHAAASRRGRSRLARTASSSPSVNGGSNSGRHLLSSPFVASPQSMSGRWCADQNTSALHVKAAAGTHEPHRHRPADRSIARMPAHVIDVTAC